MEAQTEYKTLRAEDPDALDSLVNSALKDGFDLYGHPYVLQQWICQAVVKSKDGQSMGFR